MKPYQLAQAASVKLNFTRKPRKPKMAAATFYPWGVERQAQQWLGRYFAEFGKRTAAELLQENGIYMADAVQFPQDPSDPEQLESFARSLFERTAEHSIKVHQNFFVKLKIQNMGIPDLSELRDDFVKSFVDRCVTTGNDEKQKIAAAIYDFKTMRGKTADKELREQIQDIESSYSDKWASFIARNEIGNLNATISMKQAEAGGFEMYEWLCTQDEATRPAHEAMDGKICRYDDGSVYSDDGGKTWKKRTGSMFHGMVGTDYNCRCVGVAYAPDLYADEPPKDEPGNAQEKADNEASTAEIEAKKAQEELEKAKKALEQKEAAAQKAAWEASRKRNMAAAVKRHSGRTQADIDLIRMNMFTRQMAADMTDNDKKLMARNWLDIEKQAGITKGAPMTIENADKQSANPNYGKKNFDINCQTCAPAYALRLHGFNFTAKANNPGSLNEWVSKSHSFDIWKNPDGSKAKPALYIDWLNKKGYKTMTAKRYTEFFEENCKDTGVYVVTIAWKRKYAHATILQRLENGKLVHIEPQVYRGTVKQDYIQELSNNGTSSRWKLYGRGVMRIDNKIFDTNYLSIFDK